VLYEKQTEAEIGELLRRLQGSDLAAELGDFEQVRYWYWMVLLDGIAGWYWCAVCTQ